MAFFSDGVSEEILGRITRGSKLTVIGRTSSFQFRGTDKARAATMLGASHILDGSIQRAGGRVRISAHLVEAATQTNLWSNHYDRGLDDIFALQDEIAEAIATSLDTAFSLVRAAPVDPAVYDLYLRAKVRVTNIVQMEKNVASLEHVTQMDAHFTAGWGTIAYRRAELMMHSPYAQRATIRAHVEGDIARCRALDPGHPDANAAAWVLMEPYGAFLKQDAALNSNSVADFDSVDFLTARAYFLECVGRGTEAAEQAAEAAALDGLNAFAVGMRGQALWRAGQFARGRAVMESVHARWPDSHHTVAVLIQACVHQLDWPRVERLTDPERLAIYPLREHAGVVGFARVMREPGAANRCRMFDAICKRAKATGHIDPQVAAIAAELGFVGEVYDLLDQMKFGPAGHHRDVMGTHAYRTLLLFPKAYRALRDDPRFVTLCARLGLVDYWLTTRHWPDCADDVPYDFRGECARAVDVRRDIFGF
jgi:TolB-like protein